LNSETVKVAMVILYSQGRVLMQLRGRDQGVYAGGMWGIFGGHLEPGEDPEACARREISEELGVALEGPLRLFTHRTDEGRERYVYAAPLTVPLSGLSLAEGDGMALLGRTDLDGYPIVPVHREVLISFFSASV
jgi:8-oxo-dGTP diphosphatase